MTLSKPAFSSPLEASAYLHPTEPSPYTSLRKQAVEIAVKQGYDYSTLTEIPVDWSTDQDPNNHVSNPTYARFFSTAQMRLVESLMGEMGPKFRDAIRGRSIGPVAKGYSYDLKAITSYPDAVLVGHRLLEVKLDRYRYQTTVWSLVQQKVVADSIGWIVFLDFATGRPANLLRSGEEYVQLHARIEEQFQASKKRLEEFNCAVEKAKL